MTAAECRELAQVYRSRSKEPALTQRKISILTNISRSLSGLANQARDAGYERRRPPAK